jgi:hypothetical protein
LKPKNNIDKNISICYNEKMSLFGSEGKRKFDECTLKSIEYEELVFTNAARSEIYPVDEAREDYSSAGVRPRLRCPKTEDMGGDPICSDKERTFGGYYNKSKGLANLRKVAGATACTACEYAGKTVIEVADMRTERAEAEQRALLAEANLKHLQQKITNGQDVVTDLAPNGIEYVPTTPA